MNASVEVSLHDFFDSIPNFIRSGPARSLETTMERQMQIDPVSITYPPASWRVLRENCKDTNHHSQFIPYPSGYAVPKPVPRNWYPALNPLVLSFHVWLLSNSSSENRPAVSPSSGLIRSRRPRRWRSIPLPVAASRVSRVCVCIALFKSSNLRFDCFAETVRSMSKVTYEFMERRNMGGDKRRQEGAKKTMTDCERVNNNVALPHTQ